MRWCKTGIGVVLQAGAEVSARGGVEEESARDRGIKRERDEMFDRASALR